MDHIIYYTPLCYGSMKIIHKSYEDAFEIRNFHLDCQMCNYLLSLRRSLKRKYPDS